MLIVALNKTKIQLQVEAAFCDLKISDSPAFFKKGLPAFVVPRKRGTEQARRTGRMIGKFAQDRDLAPRAHHALAWKVVSHEDVF